MKTETPKTIALTDYTKTNYEVDSLDLDFELGETKTIVTSVAKYRWSGAGEKSLFLNGENQKLISVMVDDKEIKEYTLNETSLELKDLPEVFILTIVSENNPTENKTLEGLYYAADLFCTQCEAEGFRRITYFYDRPDVMTEYNTKITADKKKFPILLSNGNPVDSGDLNDGRHWVKWNDPFKKPSYLFALVAGDLGLVEDTYKTGISGRDVKLQIFCDKGNEDKCHHAMRSLINSMKWDEEKYGLEYDLDIYMIVAVDSFNMGAMENKGLNVFNSAFVLAKQETATDENFLGIESVVGHEYFHNWTGNRVTCRDWFQLTLKEGLTVYRDQEFSSDLNSRSVQRIRDIERLRTIQFPEDFGPTAHPIKPKSYIQINNFYTATVYEKGAEIIRMIEKIVGVEGFRKGMDKYFELFDGQAVTTEDFVHSMEVANDVDLTQFKHWYDQAGTPWLNVTESYDENEQTFTLTLSQSCPIKTYGQEWKPCHMPIALELLGENGNEYDLKVEEINSNFDTDTHIWHLKAKEETITFKGISKRPVLSINRGFSAPVILNYERSFSDKAFSMAYDTDEFNRYEAAQELALETITQLITDGIDSAIDPAYIENYGKILSDTKLEESIKALCLNLPSSKILTQYLIKKGVELDFEKINNATDKLYEVLGTNYRDEFHKLYQAMKQEEYSLDAKAIGERELKNVCLLFLTKTQEVEFIDLAYNQYMQANNMTEQIMALAYLAETENEKVDLAMKHFYDKWANETLVIQKWLAIQAARPLSSTLDTVKKLMSDKVYDKTVPNIVRSLLGAFATNNELLFHKADGSGYQFMAEKIVEADAYNPGLAVRLVSPFKIYKDLPKNLQEQMEKALKYIKGQEKLSTNLFEVVGQIYS